MRPAVISAHARMMPRIEAERALANIAQIAAGNGLMPEPEQRTYLRALKRAANGGRSEPVMKATTAGLSQIGIQVKTVEGTAQREDFLTASALAKDAAAQPAAA